MIIGTAPGWRNDVAGAKTLARHANLTLDVCAINYAGIMYLDPIQHWVTLHGANFCHLANGEDGWIKQRQDRGGDMDVEIHTTAVETYEGAHVYKYRAPYRNGTSALLAAFIMHEHLNYNRIILAGVHLLGLQTDHITLEDRPNGHDHFQRAWEREADTLRTFCRSMGGWTRELLGEPSEEWLRA